MLVGAFAIIIVGNCVICVDDILRNSIPETPSFGWFSLKLQLMVYMSMYYVA